MKPLTLHCRITDATGEASCGPWQIGPGAEWQSVDGKELAGALRAAADRLESVIAYIEGEAAGHAGFSAASASPAFRAKSQAP